MLSFTKKQKISAIIIIAAVCILIALLILINNTKEEKDGIPYGSNYEKAMQSYYDQEQSRSVTTKQLDGMLLDSFYSKDSKFYVMLEYDNDKNPYVYVLGVEKADDRYYCEKASADISLGAYDNVDKSKQAPDSEYIIPIGDNKIHVGMVHDYNNIHQTSNENLSVDKNGIYCYID